MQRPTSHKYEKGSILELFVSFLSVNERSPDLAELVGHMMGDGHLGRAYCYITLRPEDCETHQELFSQFGVRSKIQTFPHCDVVVRIVVCDTQFCKWLRACGAPQGNKVEQPFLVPNWIRNAPSETKARFLQAMISDEGETPKMVSTRKCSGMHFAMCKNPSLIFNHLQFMQQLRSMLSDFEVSTTPLMTRKVRPSNFATQSCVSGFLILPNRINMLRYFTSVGFCYDKKQQQMNDCMAKISAALGHELDQFDRHQRALDLYETTEMGYGRIARNLGTGKMTIKHWVQGSRHPKLSDDDFRWFSA